MTDSHDYDVIRTASRPATDTDIARIIQQRDDVRDLAAQYEAEIAQMQPVVDAAIAWYLAAQFDVDAPVAWYLADAVGALGSRVAEFIAAIAFAEAEVAS